MTKGGPDDVVFPDSFLQRWIGSGLDVEGDTSVGDLLDAAAVAWQEELGTDQPIDIQLVVDDFGTSQLAEAQIVEVDADGVPIVGRVTIDDDAAGLGWYSDLDSLPAEQQYDLYTVLLHEIGHTLGFTTFYEGFASLLQTDGQGGTVFVAADVTAELDATQQHLDADAQPDDVMNATLAPGVRKELSTLDVQIVAAAQEAARSGAAGFSSTGSAVLADTDAAGLADCAYSTADFDRLDGKLEGEATWDRLLGDRDERTGKRLRSDVVDSLCDLDLARLEEAARATVSKRDREEVRFDGNFEGFESHDMLGNLATLRHQHRDGRDTLDAVFTEWESR